LERGKAHSEILNSRHEILNKFQTLIAQTQKTKRLSSLVFRN